MNRLVCSLIAIVLLLILAFPSLPVSASAATSVHMRMSSKSVTSTQKMKQKDLEDDEEPDFTYDEDALKTIKRKRVRWKVKKMVDLAISLQGKPYAKIHPKAPKSFDCSSFVQYVVKKTLKIKMNSAPRYQASACKRNKKCRKIYKIKNLRIGDLVFFNTIESTKYIDHVGICLGKYGNQTLFIHASTDKDEVMISHMSGKYGKSFSFGARIVR